MKNILRILITLTLFVSCDNHSNINKTKRCSLDSILNFDTITAIYSANELPPRIIDDAIEDTEKRAPLHIDSINHWTNSKSIIDRIRVNFPKLESFGNGVWETTCCGNHEMIIKTKNGEYTIYWLNFNDYGGVKINEKYYKTNRKQLNRIINLLDRKIIRTEIYSVDSNKYNVKDYYNKRNTNEYNIMGETRYVYILK